MPGEIPKAPFTPKPLRGIAIHVPIKYHSCNGRCSVMECQRKVHPEDLKWLGEMWVCRECTDKPNWLGEVIKDKEWDEAESQLDYLLSTALCAFDY